MIYNFLDLVFETISYLFFVDEVRLVIIGIAFMITIFLIIIVMVFFGKKADRSRAVASAMLILYDFSAFVLTIFCRWWFAIIMITICLFWIRSREKLIWKGEIERKKIEADLKDLLIRPQGILLNVSISFLFAQVILLYSAPLR